jgi:hypothetical protein
VRGKAKKMDRAHNMTNLELVLNMLAEVSTTEISKKKKFNGERKQIVTR